MPYNYLLDVFLLNTYAELVEGNIIVFDEAHNIPEAAESGRTNVISTTTFDLAVAELNRIFGSTVS